MTQIEIRHMPEGYAADCWIVTGPIHSSEIRYYRTLTGAKKYAKDLIKALHNEQYHPRLITIEQRLYDRLSRVKIIEE